ncbi:MAG: DUF393 domain-containing protein [Motiliproteus sp.]|nr:DUF393 domain-containing protein [Motiliproteus sp.]
MSEPPSTNPPSDNDHVTVFYDGSCPRCIKDRARYQQLAGKLAEEQVCWVDITGREEELRGLGIDPKLALTELHVQLSDQQIVSELDAYIVLMQRVWLLKPVAWLVGLPVIRPSLAKLYHFLVERRLRKEGRFPQP